MIALSAKGIVLEGFEAKNSSKEYGIGIGAGSNNMIRHNRVSGNHVGIQAGGDNQIMENEATANDYGIMLYKAENNIISYNNISGNRWDGIEIFYCSEPNTIEGNRIISNGYPAGFSGAGISLENSGNENIKSNNIENNQKYGIRIYSFGQGTSTDNTILCNLVNNNKNGIYSP